MPEVDPTEDRTLSPVAYDDVIDPDVDQIAAVRPRSNRPRQWDIVLATSLGGIVGAEARYGVGLAVPHQPDQFPWSTVLINATGCLVIGALMVILLELTSPHRLARPFLGVGVLGGYTTFSTFAGDAERLVVNHRAGTALAYIIVTVAVCGAAVWLSTVATQVAGQAVIDRRVRRRDAGAGGKDR